MGVPDGMHEADRDQDLTEERLDHWNRKPFIIVHLNEVIQRLSQGFKYHAEVTSMVEGFLVADNTVLVIWVFIIYLFNYCPFCFCRINVLLHLFDDLNYFKKYLDSIVLSFIPAL